MTPVSGSRQDGTDRRFSEISGFIDREPVTAFIFRVSGMTFNPGERKLVYLLKLVQFLPEFHVFDLHPFPLFFVSPAVFLLVGHPGRETVQNIGAVRNDFQRGRAFERGQSLNNGGQLHLIIGRPLHSA